jgi:uncharacterized NAD-dependent epimerase/dehydratase family protein
MLSTNRRIAVLAEGSLDFHFGKTAISILRYQPESVVCVIDRDHAGLTAQQILGLGGAIPVCANVEEALRLDPTELLIGIAPRGGGLPDSWRAEILRALSSGLDVVSGLHFMLGEDREFQAAAQRHGAHILDVRKSPEGLQVARLRARRPGACVVTFVGSDCAVGKMTAALEMHAAAARMGVRSSFVATGQIGDFMAGALEELVVEAAEEADLVFVEGQGSLLHPGYSGVTLALIHGSAPDAMVLVHPPSRRSIDGYGLPIPPLDRLITIYEEAAGWVKPARVAAIALNTRDLDPGGTETAIRDAEALTGLPATDPVKFGGERLVQALIREGAVSALTGKQ